MPRALALAFATLVLAACGGGAAGQGSSTPAAPAPTVAPTSSAACGEGASLALEGASPVGRTFHAGDTLKVSVLYEGPGCKMLGGVFHGYYGPDTRWYKQTCAPRCTGRVPYSFLAPAAQLTTAGGTFDAVADVASAGSPDYARRPPVDGFTLCDIELSMNDGVFAGRHFEQTIGNPC
jgi:hypothetical protein